MGSFAPAPWQIIPYVDGIDIVDANGQLVARVADRAIDGKGLPPANSRLIAAAPELLAALEVLVSRYPNNIGMAKARAAIAKVKGEPK